MAVPSRQSFASGVSIFRELENIEGRMSVCVGFFKDAVLLFCPCVSVVLLCYTYRGIVCFGWARRSMEGRHADTA